jgi:hypothetical protein
VPGEEDCAGLDDDAWRNAWRVVLGVRCPLRRGASELGMHVAAQPTVAKDVNGYAANGSSFWRKECMLLLVVAAKAVT